VGPSGLIDVHHHIVPADYRVAIDAATGGSIGGIPQPAWDEHSMLERMDEVGIARALVSVSAPALGPIDADARPRIARMCNSEIAALRATYPDRIGGFAVLPLPDVAASMAEIAYALDELGLDGVSLLTNYDGRYLGDPLFEPVLAELDRRGVVAHVHPNLPPAMADARLRLPAPVLEFTFDTTRMVAELILGETLLRYERLTLVLSHLGGTLPWVAWRLSMLDEFPSARGSRREPVRDQLRRLYYDVALSASPSGLTMAAEVIGADRLLYGSDVPFAPASFIDANTASLTHRIDGADLFARTRDNAERLFDITTQKETR
jgi:predicted TIM-barrel fold metal-dependent hydrolase